MYPRALRSLSIAPGTAVGLTASVGLAVAALTRPLDDPDTWWHLRIGEWMIDHGEVIRTDLFSFTRFGEPFLPHSWLAEVSMAMAAMADLRGVLLWAATLLIAAYGLLAGAVLARVPSGRQLEGWGLVILAAVSGAASWGARPYLYSYVLLIATLMLLDREDRWRWGLVPLFALWVNLHGLWLVGLGLVAIRLGADVYRTRRLERRWLTLGIACSAVTLVNPFGWRLHEQVVDLVRGMAEVQVVEWRSADLTTPPQWALLGFALLAAWLLWRDRDRVTSFEVAVAAFAVLLSAVAVRNLAPAGLMLAFVTAPHVPRQRTQDAVPGALGTLAALVAIVSLTVVGVARFPASERVGDVSAGNLPIGLISELDAGRVFAVDAWGGIVTYLRWPDVLVAYDTRIDFYGQRGYDRYRDVLSGDDGSVAWLRDQCVDQVLGYADWPLVHGLEKAGGWVRREDTSSKAPRKPVLLRRIEPTC